MLCNILDRFSLVSRPAPTLGEIQPPFNSRGQSGRCGRIQTAFIYLRYLTLLTKAKDKGRHDPQVSAHKPSENGDYIMWIINTLWLFPDNHTSDRLCGLVVTVPGLQIQRSGFHSRCYQIFWEVVVWNRVHSPSWVQLRSRRAPRWVQDLTFRSLKGCKELRTGYCANRRRKLMEG
jgi:hypothetical protein